MTLKERILALLAVEALDDDELAARLGVVRQQVNQTCRAMEYDGLLTRQRGPSGKIVNRVTEAGAQLPMPRGRSSTPSTPGHANHRGRRQGCCLGLAGGEGV